MHLAASRSKAGTSKRWLVVRPPETSTGRSQPVSASAWLDNRWSSFSAGVAQA